MLDRILVCKLPSRYGIARSALYTRMKDLGIKPEKEGKQSYIGAEEMELLDALHEHLQRGGTTSEFLLLHNDLTWTDWTKESGTASDYSLAVLVEQLKQAPEIKLLLTAISHLLLAKAHYFEPNINPFKCRLLLSEAVSSSCILTSSELIAILKIEKIPRLKKGQFARKGFLFTRVERNSEIPLTSGREAEWKVSKLEFDKEEL